MRHQETAWGSSFLRGWQIRRSYRLPNAGQPKWPQVKDSYEFYKEIELSVEGSFLYRIRFLTVNEPKDARNSVREMTVERSHDLGATWSQVPLNLSFWSKLLLWISASPYWPPEVPTAMGCTNDEVWFEYVDAPDEEPGWMRKHSLWRATLTKGGWRIVRCRQIEQR